MNSPDYGFDYVDTDDSQESRYSVVSEWYDAGTMGIADLTDELAGQRVIAFAGDDYAESYSPAVGLAYGADTGVTGFLFNGDDGDSLWFWPESEDIAFRFAPETGNLLRRELSENISRLLSQGALVFCQKVDLAESGDTVFEFPVLQQKAA